MEAEASKKSSFPGPSIDKQFRRGVRTFEGPVAKERDDGSSGCRDRREHERVKVKLRGKEGHNKYGSDYKKSHRRRNMLEPAHSGMPLEEGKRSLDEGEHDYFGLCACFRVEDKRWRSIS